MPLYLINDLEPNRCDKEIWENYLCSDGLIKVYYIVALINMIPVWQVHQDCTMWLLSPSVEQGKGKVSLIVAKIILERVLTPANNAHLPAKPLLTEPWLKSDKNDKSVIIL